MIQGLRRTVATFAIALCANGCRSSATVPSPLRLYVRRQTLSRAGRLRHRFAFLPSFSSDATIDLYILTARERSLAASLRPSSSIPPLATT